MDLLHENGLIFGNSVCYTSKNMDAVTSDEFFDLLIEHGSRFAWYFHLMPVGMKASPELSRTMESMLADVSPEEETTATSTRRVMLSRVYLFTIQEQISVRSLC